LKRDVFRSPERKRKGRLRRGMYIIPSLFTSGNIAAGYFAITQSLQGSVQEPQHFNYAALAIGFAIPFDALDGRIARMTKTTSDFGKELDSLADVITFGVAPSLLAFTWGFQTLPMAMDPVRRQHVVQWGAFVCFLFLLCGAGRLARFNIGTNLLPKNPGRPLCGHADSCRRRGDCGCRPFLFWDAGAQLARRRHVDGPGLYRWVAHGEYLAFLER
jgi:CDP-diacylglycerol--serine O-phosphatidyltransferase